MSFSDSCKSLFKNLSENLFSQLGENEKLTLSFHGEQSDFLRFNQGKARQATTVEQLDMHLQLFIGTRNSHLSLQLALAAEDNVEKAVSALKLLRNQTSLLPEDPYAVLPTNNGQSDESHEGELLDRNQLGESLFSQTQGLDFVGYYQGGPVVIGSSNSEGQFHWFSTKTFATDYSLYAENSRAVKGTYAGSHWKKADFASSLNESKVHLEKLLLPSKKIELGAYKTYLAPAAVNEILETIQWGGLSYKALKMGSAPLEDLSTGKSPFSKKISMKENFSMGLTPRFNETGEVAPSTLSFIENGEFKNWLVSSKSAKEFGVDGNCATDYESPRALEVSPGTLDSADVLAKLGTGLYLSNLHYLNWSDMKTARITGMTRFACFWVENGEIVAPIEDMRFDVSLYDILGENLQEVGSESQTIVGLNTYHQRHVQGVKTPGLLINDFKFTL